MRILLVKSAHITSTDVSIIPPLGLLYLASAVREARPGDEIRMLDLRVESERAYVQALNEWRPDVVGISTLTAEADHAHALSAQAARLAPQATVIWGGPHPTGYVDESLRDPNVDVLVLQEGERTFVELLDALATHAPLEPIAGLAFRHQDRTHRTPPRPVTQDLDQLPQPAWDMVDFRRYERVKSMSMVGPRRVAPVMTSRACPYRCTYCHTMFGKGLQQRSPDNVMAELTLLRKTYGVDHVEIIDDIFNADRRRSLTILNRIADSGLDLKLSFPNGLRGDILRAGDIDTYKRAGTIFVSVAVETASPRLQRQIRKNIRLDRVQTSIRGFAERGIFTNCYYMLGFPGETRAEMRQTVEFALAQPSHTALFFVVNPFKGTELGEAYGADADTPYSSHSYHDVEAGNLSEVSHRQVTRIIKLAYVRFFLDPRRMWRLLRDHPQRSYLPLAVALLIKRLMGGTWNEPALLRKWRRSLGAERLRGDATRPAAASIRPSSRAA